MIILYTPYFFAFWNSMQYVSPNLNEVSVYFKFFGYCLLLIIFCVLYVFNPSLFLSWSWFFDISVNSSKLWRQMLRVPHYYFGGGVHSSFNGIFSVDSNPLFISIAGYPFWWRIMCNPLGKFVKDFCLWLWYRSSMLGCKEWILCSFWSDDSYWNGGIVGCLWTCSKYLW